MVHWYIVQLPACPTTGDPVEVSRGPVGTRKTTWYYYDGSFVYRPDGSTRVFCSSASCFGKCHHVQAVDAFLQIPSLGQNAQEVEDEHDMHKDEHDVPEGDEAEGEPMSLAGEESDPDLEGSVDDDHVSPDLQHLQHGYNWPHTTSEAWAMHRLHEEGLLAHDVLGLVLAPQAPALCGCGKPYCDGRFRAVRTNCTVYLPHGKYSRTGVTVVDWLCPDGMDACTLQFSAHQAGLFEMNPASFIAVR